MATIAEKIAALDSQRAQLGARCGECGYDLSGESTLYQIMKALYKQAMGWDMVFQPGPYDYAVELRDLREITASSVNSIYGTALDENAVTFAEIIGAIQPLAAPDEAYAVAVPDASASGKYELRFFRAESAPAVGDAYEGATIAHVFSGFETTAYASNSKVPWYPLHADITAVVFDDAVRPVSCAYWFYWQQNCTRYDLAKLDTSACTSFAFMFYSCTALESLDLSGLATPNVTTINYMFYNCTKLSNLTLGAWDMRNVDVWAQAFRNLTAITELDFSRCTLPEYTSTLYYCFYNCSKLVRIYAPAGGDLSDTSLAGYCFGGCRSLVGGAGTAWTSGNVGADMARVDGLGGLPGYFTAR